WQTHSALATKEKKHTWWSVRNGVVRPSWSSWSRHSLRIRPERNSRAPRQTTSGRSPRRGIHSKSQAHSSSKGNARTLLRLVTGRPLQEQRVSGAVDHATLVAKRYSEDLCLLEFRPDRIRETFVRCREYLVVSVFPVGVEPYPLAGPFDQPDLPRAV